MIAYQQATLGGRGQVMSGLMSGMNGMAFCTPQDDSADADCSSHGRTWMTGTGSTTHQTGTANTASTLNAAYAMQVGIEQRSIDQTLFGFAVDMSNTSFSVKDRWTSGTVDGISASAFGMGWSSDGLYGKALMSLGAHRNSISRSALGRATGGTFASYAAGAGFEAGARMGGHAAGITPFAGVSFDLLYQPGWGETNATYGNRYDAQLTRSTRINMGFGLDTLIRLGETSSLKLYSNFGFEHEFSTSRVQTAHSLAAPGFKWQTEGLSAPSNKLTVDVGLEYKPTRNLTLQLKGGHTAYQGGSSSSASLSLSGRF